MADRVGGGYWHRCRKGEKCVLVLPSDADRAGGWVVWAATLRAEKGDTRVSAEQDLVDELVRLRRGWGLPSRDLRRRIGPELIRLCDIGTADSDRVVHDKIRSWLGGRIAELPPELARVAVMAFGMDREHQYRHLTARVDYLAMEQSCAPRTVRRRIAHADRLLAHAALRQWEDTEDADPETGWHLRELRSVLRLDTAEPRLYETRVVVADRPNLDRVVVRLSVPPSGDGAGGDRHDLVAEVEYGARVIDAQETPNASHFRWDLRLTRRLQIGDEHEFQLSYRLPPGHPPRPHYALLPLVQCDRFDLRVRFRADRLPAAVWRLDGVPPRLLDDEAPGEDLLDLDASSEVRLGFTNLKQGRGYGVGWRPAPADRPTSQGR